MNNLITLKILTPQSIIKQPSSIIILPGEEGELGILPSHSPLIANLKTGIIKINYEQKEMKYFISSGIAHVKNEEVEIITDFFIDLATITNQEVVQKITNLEMLISNPGEIESNSALYKHQLALYKTLLSLISSN